MSAEASIQSYSDEALVRALEQMARADHPGRWGRRRLAVLKAEVRRRRLKRRGSGIP